MVYLDVGNKINNLFDVHPIDPYQRHFSAAKDEIRDWIAIQRIFPSVYSLYDGDYRLVGPLRHISFNVLRGLVGMHLGFESEDDAMLFKLTWL